MVFRSRAAKLFAAFAIASVGAKAFGGIEFINKADGLPLDEKQQCAVELCGPVPWPKAVPPRLEAAHTKIFDSELRNGLTVWMNLLAKDLDYMVAAEAQATELSKMKLSGKFRGFANFFWATETLSKYSEHFAYEGKKLVLKDSFEKAASHFSAADLRFLRKAFNIVFASEELRIESALSSLDLNSAIIELYQDRVQATSLSQVKAEFAKDLLAKFKQLQKLVPEMGLRTPPPLFRLARGEDISSAQLKIIAEGVGSLIGLKVVYSQKIFFESRLPNIKEMVQTKLKTVMPTVKTNRSIVANLKETVLDRCKSSVSKALAVHVTARQIEIAKQVSEQVRRSTIKQIAKEFSYNPKLVAFLSKLVTEARFRFPDTAAQTVAQLRSQIANGILEERSSEQARKLSPKISMLFSLLTEDAEPLFQSVQDICLAIVPEPLSDNARTALGLISVGHESVQNPAVGRAVMAHELGHVVYAALQKTSLVNKILGGKNASEDRFARLENCLSAKHGSQAGRKDTADEDFSDWLSAKVIADLSTQKLRTSNLGCALLGGDGLTYGTLNGLTLKWPANFDDTHSPSLLRLLGIEVERGRQLPRICSDLVRKVLPREAMESCSL